MPNTVSRGNLTLFRVVTLTLQGFIEPFGGISLLGDSKCIILELGDTAEIKDHIDDWGGGILVDMIFYMQGTGNVIDMATEDKARFEASNQVKKGNKD